MSADFIPASAVAANRTDSGAKRIDDLFDGDMDRSVLVTTPTIVRVIASFTPLDAPLLDQPLGFFSNVSHFPGSSPPRLVAMFDARNGARLSALPFDPYASMDQVASVLAAPTAAITFSVTVPPPTPTQSGPTWAPTSLPTAAPTPIGSPVNANNVPPAMRSVLAAYPLLPGSTWTWETTSWQGGVRWERSRMTETVLGAWRLDEEHAAVRSRVQRRQTYRPPAAGETELEPAREEWRTVTADGAVVQYSATPQEGMDDGYLALTSAKAAPSFGLPIEALHYPNERFDWSFPEAITTTRITVTTPAGRFEGCGVFEVTGGAAFASLRAMCPGVGYVETDSWHGSSNGFGRSVTRLVAYHVVLPR